MRTAVLRINVDPDGQLTAAQLADGTTRLRAQAASIAAQLPDDDLAAKPARRREVQLLVETDDSAAVMDAAIRVCAAAFGTAPAPGVVTFVSRGTDDDARGVLAGFGVTGEITRSLDADGFDVVSVTLRASDLERVPESRIHTALEASLNCEVRIHTR
ncbi:hypothetical protein [Nocardia implantans]|uniref:Uncharacterized protein n=1 Tax=Nocardia implantans TaxID=3108168 RepID=A0ABU6ARV5_9NOCA|nr:MULTISPECIES: hypothetical protein [unclassified Nocardia]MBF6191575.1 hypothetical protein [Nocardia beijingensis]MEA3528118.1 hypothetical protein [Nocardia sp. CDC192]MEB3510130.1 hypothetical protein [Nocardia sp. CDC186]